MQHQKILAGRLRDEARHADKKWKWHDARWWQAHSRRRLSDADADWWSRTSAQLQEEADRRWAEAREESVKLGHPYQERDGSMYRPGPPPRLGLFEHSLKILVERIEAGEVTWPPAP